MAFSLEVFLDILLPAALWLALWFGSKAPAKRILAHYLVTFSSLIALSGLLILLSGPDVLPNGLLIPGDYVRVVFVFFSSLMVAFLVLGADGGSAAYEVAYQRFHRTKKEFLAVFVLTLSLSLLYISFDDARAAVDLLGLVVLGPIFYLVGKRIRGLLIQGNGVVPAPLGRLAIITLLLLSAFLPYLSTLFLPSGKKDLISLVERHMDRLESVVSPEAYTLFDKNIETNRIGEVIPVMKLEGMRALRSFIERSDCCYDKAFYLFRSYLGVVNFLYSLSFEPSVTLPVTPKMIVEEFRSSLDELEHLKNNVPNRVLVAYLQALQSESEVVGASPPTVYGESLSTLLLNFADYLSEKERRQFDDWFSHESSKILETSVCLSQLWCYRILKDHVVKRDRWGCEEALELFHDLKADVGLCASLLTSDEREKVKRYLEVLVSCGSEQAAYILEKEINPLDTDPLLLRSRRKVFQKYCEALDVNVTSLAVSPKVP